MANPVGGIRAFSPLNPWFHLQEARQEPMAGKQEVLQPGRSLPPCGPVRRAQVVPAAVRQQRADPQQPDVIGKY